MSLTKKVFAEIKLMIFMNENYVSLTWLPLLIIGVCY